MNAVDTMPLRTAQVLTKDASGSTAETQIRLRAYMLYVERGGRDGFALDDWLHAEAETLGKRVPGYNKILPEDIDRTKAEYEREAWDADSVYRIVRLVLTTQWGRYLEMADAITVLLVTWNDRFYRPRGMFDPKAIEIWLQDHWGTLSAFRNRQIDTLCQGDEAAIVALFDSLWVATEVASGKHKGKRSPVSVAKALHLLAPEFFPAWDQYIADGYGCGYSSNPSRVYLRFCYMIRYQAETLISRLPLSDKTVLKRIDEYNFVTFTLPKLRANRGKGTKRRLKQKKGASGDDPVMASK